MEEIVFRNGSKIVLLGLGDLRPEDHEALRGKGFFWSNDIHGGVKVDKENLNKLLEEKAVNQGNIKFFDKHGNEQAKIPAHSDLLNAIVGYDHDPQTHDYNRAERRRIIKMAKKLDKKYGKKK